MCCGLFTLLDLMETVRKKDEEEGRRDGGREGLSGDLDCVGIGF